MLGIEKTKPICDGTNERKVFLERILRQKAASLSREKQSQTKPISVSAGGFIVYNRRDI